MDSHALTEALIAELRGTGGHTIPEVLALLERLGVATEGENAMMYAEYVVAWLGLSAEASAALNALVADERAEVAPSSAEAYLAVGYEPPFPPIAPKDVGAPYDSPRWLPTEIIVRR